MVLNILKKTLNKIGKYLVRFTGKEDNTHASTISDNSKSIYEKEEKKEEFIDEIYSIWDYLEFKENTQAYYLVKIMGFEEWISMEEIKRRILELFGVSFKHEKSLYSYLKTLVDAGLLEYSNHGGRRLWRKKDLIIRLKKKKEKSLTSELQIT